jgi:hypothetical protein
VQEGQRKEKVLEKPSTEILEEKKCVRLFQFKDFTAARNKLAVKSQLFADA